VLLTADNPDLKLLPGMTANASIVTEQKEKVLRVSNAALRFKMPESSTSDKLPKATTKEGGSTTGASSSNAGEGKSKGGKPYAGGVRTMTRKVWVLEEVGLKSKPVQKTIRVGMSDGAATEVLPDQEGNYGLKAGDTVIVGVSSKSGGSSGATRPTGPRLF
jgi:HlyD family secretion protein